MRKIILFLLSFISLNLFSQDSTLLKVHFLYGSKPHKNYKDTEYKWFGGILGGHVGIELEQDKILNFLPSGKFHYIGKNKKRHSAYALHSEYGFYTMFGGNPDSVKKAIIYIPISNQQFQQFQAISQSYLKETPYDYAFVGMRCGSATYEILAQLGILKSRSKFKNIFKVFYPKKLRRRLLKKARKNHWKVIQQQGTKRRKWEKDVGLI